VVAILVVAAATIHSAFVVAKAAVASIFVGWFTRQRRSAPTAVGGSGRLPRDESGETEEKGDGQEN
jgi:hypothetical protein